MQDKHFLEKVKWGVIPIIDYKGVLVTKTKEGYLVFNKKAKQIEDVENIINNSLQSLEKSIIS